MSSLSRSTLYLLVSLVLGFLLLSAAAVYAFTGPTANPPTGGGAVGAASGAAANSLYINSSGNVGVGTTTPNGDLHVSDNGGDGDGTSLRLTNTGAGGADIFLVSLDNGWGAGGNKLGFGFGGFASANIKASLDSAGTFTATTKNFQIEHPTKSGYLLVHSTLEGPEIAVYYRGTGRLHDGVATITLPDYFDALTRDGTATVLLTAKGDRPFALSYAHFDEHSFAVHGDRPDGEFDWEVKAARADQPPLQVEAQARYTSPPQMGSGSSLNRSL